MELRTAGGQGKWDRAVETRERGACLPHLSPHEHQGVAPPGPGRSRDMCDPNSVSPLTAGPGWCEGWQTALFEGTFSYYRLLVFAPFSLLSGDPASPSTEIQLQASPPPTSWPQPSTDKAHSQRGQAPAGSQRKGASSVITPPRTGLPGPGERWVRGKQYLVTVRLKQYWRDQLCFNHSFPTSKVAKSWKTFATMSMFTGCALHTHMILPPLHFIYR